MQVAELTEIITIPSKIWNILKLPHCVRMWVWSLKGRFFKDLTALAKS